MFKLGDVITELQYEEVADFCNENNYILTPLDDETYRIDVFEMSQHQKNQGELNILKNWFDVTYTRQEQKLRRLIALDLLCEDGAHPTDKLNELYRIAENNRKRIQDLEVEIEKQA